MTEPKRSQNPKGPLSGSSSPNGYSISENALGSGISGKSRFAFIHVTPARNFRHFITSPHRFGFRNSFGFCLFSLLLLFATWCRAIDTTGGAFATGNYRNLFAEAGHSDSTCRQKIDAAFQQLFHGNAVTQAVYYSAGSNSNGPLAFVSDIANQDVRSEGMSYGMMIAVQLDRKPEFDALWNWARTFMYHAATNHPAAGYFSWSMQTNGLPNDEMPAPDGEEYFVTALYFASGRWGDGAGIYNYKAQADQLLSNLKNRRLICGKTIRGTQTGRALFDPVQKMVRFTADETDGHTDPSYHLPAFYELWARCGPRSDQDFWRQAANASRNLFQRAAHPATALSPDYANFDGRPWNSPRNTGSADFRFDAWRVAMNWSVDWSWWQADPRERSLSDRLLAFFDSRDFPNYGNQFALDGGQLSSDHSTGLAAMNAVAALAATRPSANKYVEELWASPVPSGQWRYYDGMLYLLGMLHCSGEFRIWLPHS